MKALITNAVCDTLKPGEFVSDTKIAGFRVRCLPSGVVTFGIQFSHNGKRPYQKLGIYGEVSAQEARDGAEKVVGLVADRRDPVAEAKADAKRSVNTIKFICEQWLRLYARGDKKLRSAGKIEAVFRRHVYPVIGDKVLYDLTRADVTAMADKIEASAGTPMADVTVAHLAGVLNWWRLRDDQFITMPIVKGMARSDTEARKGKRKLDLDEIRDVWRALDEIEPGQAPPFFAAYVRVLLLTGCRRNEVARMHDDEFGDDNHVGDWTIPASRYKTKIDHLLPLPEIVRGMLPTEHKRGYVFSSNGGRNPFAGFSKSKAALDAAVRALRKREGRKPMPKWRLHDLRRTARSMMTSKPVGINRDHAERVIGHKIRGVEGVYDVHEYREEKFDALTKLATYVLGAVEKPSPPTATNVVNIKGKRSPARSAATTHRKHSNIAG